MVNQSLAPRPQTLAANELILQMRRRERAFVLIAEDDPKAPMDPPTLMWLSLAVLEDQLMRTASPPWLVVRLDPMQNHGAAH